MKLTLLVSAAFSLCVSTGLAWAETAEEAIQDALTLEKQGHLDAAVAACDRALAMANSYWLPPALYTKAKVCLSAGCKDDAVAAIQRLRTEYPESASTVQAGIIEAQILGIDPSAAEAAYQRELEAGQQVDEAIKLADANQSDVALDLLSGVVRNYPSSAAALRALDAQGHLLIRLGRREEAMSVFAELLQRTAQMTPNARIAQRAYSRLGVLCRGSGRITEAEDIFAALAREDNDPQVASQAALQLIGIQYERIRTPVFKSMANNTYDKQQADHAGWAVLRQQCQELIDTPWCQPRELIRAELIQIESYCWEQNTEAAVKAGAAFTRKYDGSPFVDELVHCRLFVGIALKRAIRYQEALEQFQWVRENAPDAAMAQRCWYELWVVLNRLKAAPDQIKEVEDVVLTKYPGSPSARCIQLINRQKAKGYVWNAP